MEDRKFKSGRAYLLQRLYNYYTQPIELNKDSRTTGLIGWLFLALIVIAYDLYAIKTKNIETLTRAFWRMTEKPLSRIPFMVLWMVLTFHLIFEKDIRRKRTQKY
jgi:hypothetical protein